MNRPLSLIFASVLIVLPATSNIVAAQAAVGCNTHPVFSFNGRVKIPYPSGNGSASVIQFCDPASATFKKNVLRQSRTAGLDVKWVEYYRARDWVSAFHDSIYQTRSLGFQQSNYKQFSIQEWRDMETLVYANRSGKYVGMISRKVPGSSNTSEFLLYGN